MQSQIKLKISLTL